jgi:dipeptidyl aminopeptidase/acylaminoacyl peptidase
MRFFALLLMTTMLFAGDKSAFTIADLYQAKSVYDPQISPDGSQIAFVVTAYDLPKSKRETDIYIMDFDGKNQRQLTHNAAADYYPRWSHDGKQLLFLSTRSGKAQAWIMPMNGGEARQVTDFYMGVKQPEWAANGEDIYFISTVFPEAGADNTMNMQLSEDLRDGPVKAHLADELLYRHWTWYRDWKYKHLFKTNVTSGETVELTRGEVDMPAYSLGGREYSVAMDGRYLAFGVKDVENPASSTNNDILLLDLESNKTINITKDNKGFDGHPLFSPNSRYVAYHFQETPGYEADRFQLAVYEVATGKKIVLAQNVDNWITDFRWSPNSSMLYFKVHEKGHFPIYATKILPDKAYKRVDLKTIGDFQVAPHKPELIVNRSSVGEPYEIWRATLALTKKYDPPQRLTFFNEALENRVDIRPAEELWIKSPTGKSIHTFIVKPHDFDPDKEYPLILNVHGGPQYQWSDGFRGDWQVYPGAGYIVAFPNPHGSTGYGQDFTHAISKDWGGKVYEDVIAVAEYLGKLDYVDEDNMGAMGWSYGGYMMMWLQGRQKHPFKTLAAMMGLYNLPMFYGATEELFFPDYDLGGPPWKNPELYAQWSPHNYVKNFKTPSLIITGELDYRVPYTQSLAYFTDLQLLGIDSRLIVFPNDGHWPDYLKSMPVYYNAHLEWFSKYLGGGKAPWDTEQLIRNQVFSEDE